MSTNPMEEHEGTCADNGCIEIVKGHCCDCPCHLCIAAAVAS